MNYCNVPGQKTVLFCSWLFWLSMVAVILVSGLTAAQVQAGLQPGLSAVGDHPLPKYSYFMLALMLGNVLYRLSPDHSPLDRSHLRPEQPEPIQLPEPLIYQAKIPDGIVTEESVPDTHRTESEDSSDQMSCIHITYGDPEQQTVSEERELPGLLMPPNNSGSYTGIVAGIISCPPGNGDEKNQGSEKDQGDAEDASEEMEQDTDAQELSVEMSHLHISSAEQMATDVISGQEVIQSLAKKIMFCQSVEEARVIVEEIQQYNIESLASAKASYSFLEKNVYLDNVSLFFLACCLGYIDIAKALYYPGINLEECSCAYSYECDDVIEDYSATCLQRAVGAGNLELVQFLLDKGADVAATFGDNTPVEGMCCIITDRDSRLKIWSSLQFAKRVTGKLSSRQVVLIIDDNNMSRFMEFPAELKIPDICVSGELLPINHPAVQAAYSLDLLRELLIKSEQRAKVKICLIPQGRVTSRHFSGANLLPGIRSTSRDFSTVAVH